MCKHSIRQTAIFFLAYLLFVSFSYGKEIKFENGQIKITLPKGWEEDALPPGSEAEAIGKVMTNKIPGSSVIIYKYEASDVKDFTYTYERMKALLKVIYPKGQKLLGKEKIKKKTKTKEKFWYERWLGIISVGEQDVTLEIPLAFIKIKDFWYVFMGFTPEITGQRFLDKFLDIVVSVKKAE